MVKVILQECRCRFFPVLKGYSTPIFIFVWLAFSYMVIFQADYLKYLWGMLPMLLGLLLSRIYPNQLSKLMLLCPMTEKDRKKYLITAYLVRVGISIGLFIVLGFLCRQFCQITLYECAAVSFLIVFFILGANMHHSFMSLMIVRQKGDKDYVITFVYGVLHLLSCVIAWFTMIFYASIGRHGLQQDTEYRALTWLTGLVVIMNAVICVCCYKPVIRHGIYYEGRAVLKRRDTEQ